MSASSSPNRNFEFVWTKVGKMRVTEGNQRVLAIQKMLVPIRLQKRTKNVYANPCKPESEIRAFRNQTWQGHVKNK